MKNKTTILIIFLVVVAMRVGIVSRPPNKSYFIWEQDRKKYNFIAIEAYLPSAANVFRGRIFLSMTAKSDDYGTFIAKLQRRDFWGRWQSISTQHLCEHDSDGKDIVLFWGCNQPGNYRVVFYSPSNAQDVAFSNVIFYRK